MNGKRYMEEFKVAAVKQVINPGYPAAKDAPYYLGKHPLAMSVSSINAAGKAAA